MERLLYFIKKLIPKKLFKSIQPIYHFALSWFAAMFYRWPSEHLIVIGVTGTTGKTTSVYLIAKVIEAAGYKVGFTSTAIFNDGQREWLNDKKMTMVGRLFTQKILRQMVHSSCQFAIVETTSEGIAQFRHRFINYDTLVFTGLYPEHIESHGSFEKYKEAKGKLFNHLKKCKTKFTNAERKVIYHASNLKKIELQRVKKTIIANGDDDHASYFLGFWAEEKYKFVSSSEASGKTQANDNENMILYHEIKSDENGIAFAIGKTKFDLKLLGRFNIQNAVAAATVGISQGIGLEAIRPGLEKVEGVAGRLERIDEGQNFTVIVDYAFEPNALAKLYETVKNIPHQRIIHILGSAGGGRDIARRPILGELAGRNSDIVIVTNEDPYDDDIQTIIDQVALGAEKAGKKYDQDLYRIEDRFEAIKKGVGLAQENDIVLITGKGSEQAIVGPNGEKIPWDDRAVARGLLNSEK